MPNFQICLNAQSVEIHTMLKFRKYTQCKMQKVPKCTKCENTQYFLNAQSGKITN